MAKEHSAHERSIAAGKTVGNWRVIGTLGRGGMGTVYEAVHEEIGKRAAIKVLEARFSSDSEMATRFLNEARAANRIAHPGIVNIFEFGRLPDGSTFIVMELLEGESLGQRLALSDGRILAEGPRLARQVASALAAAHARGIVHRDLKPGNIMIVNDPEIAGGVRAKVLDFGIAKVSGDDGSASDVRTRTGAIFGTPAYMSPEQVRSPGAVNEKADVYALGVLLFRMVAGRLPFDAEMAFDLMSAHVMQPAPPLREMVHGVPPELDALVARMLAKLPDERPSMAEVTGALDAMEQTGIVARLAALAPTLSGREAAEVATVATNQRRAVLRWVAAGVVAVMVAAAATLVAARLVGRRDAAAVVAAPVQPVIAPVGAAPVGAAPVGAAPVAAPPVGAAPVGAAPVGAAPVGAAPVAAAPVGAAPVAAAPVAAAPPAAAAPVAATAPPAPAAQRRVHWLVSSTPAGAAVVDSDGNRLGVTPFSTERDAADGTYTLVLRRPGYHDMPLSLDGSRDAKLEGKLVPARRNRATGSGNHELRDKDIPLLR